MFNLQYLGPTRSEIAANMFYKTFTTSQPGNLLVNFQQGFTKTWKVSCRREKIELDLDLMLNRQLWNTGASTALKDKVS